MIVALFVLAAGLASYTVLVAPRWLRVSRLRIALPGLDDGWEGVRISHLSDFHLGAPMMTTDHLHQARRIALDFQPDIVALTGDYYEAGSDVPSEGLYRDWPEGVFVFGVTGNHDRRGTPRTIHRVREELCASGVTLLTNEARKICLRGRGAWIAGVDDAHTFNQDVDRALAQVQDGDEVLLFLAHHPDAIQHVQPGRVRLMLAGHTHGGQVRLLPSGAVPFVKIMRKLRGAIPRPDGPVYRRWHWMKGTVLVISDGLGVSTLPVRFRTRPHLILMTLERAQPATDAACDDIERYVTEEDPEHWLLVWAT